MVESPFGRGQPRVWRENDGIRELPKQWGAYRFVREDRCVDYLGVTSNLYSRISNHRSTKLVYDPSVHTVRYQVASAGVSWSQMCEWEIHKIAKHDPALVTYKGGNGRVPQVSICGQPIELQKNESVEDAAERMGLFSSFIQLFRS